MTVDFGASKATYPTSGIVAYPTSLMHNGEFYAGEEQMVAFGTPEGLAGLAAQYTASAGELTEAEGVWTLVMPGEDVVISSSFTPVFGTADFILPGFLTEVEEEAFEGSGASVMYVPDGCASIGDHAFKDCPNLMQIRISNDCELGAEVFADCGPVYVLGDPTATWKHTVISMTI